jgi:predicted DNA-binding ribbon-helix-helix protein
LPLSRLELRSGTKARVVSGHKTSISLEDPFWKSLKEIAGLKHLTLSALLAAIDSERHEGNLSSAIRLFILRHYREQLETKERIDTALGLVNSSTQNYATLGSAKAATSTAI